MPRDSLALRDHGQLVVDEHHPWHRPGGLSCFLHFAPRANISGQHDAPTDGLDVDASGFEIRVPAQGIRNTVLDVLRGHAWLQRLQGVMRDVWIDSSWLVLLSAPVSPS